MPYKIKKDGLTISTKVSNNPHFSRNPAKKVREAYRYVSTVYVEGDVIEDSDFPSHLKDDYKNGGRITEYVEKTGGSSSKSKEEVKDPSPKDAKKSSPKKDSDSKVESSSSKTTDKTQSKSKSKK